VAVPAGRGYTPRKVVRQPALSSSNDRP
jgi:hypothetical protein